MAKGKNQKFKLAYLKEIMLRETDDSHGISLKQVIEKLDARGVSAERKSIYEDFDDLEKLGVDIISEKKGRECLYHVGGRQFELAELKLLVDAIQSSKFITEKKSRELIKKVESFASKYEESQLQRQVYVHGRIKTMNESIYYTVDSLHAAIANNKQIEFKYCEWNINKELVPKYDGKIYKVSPWALTWDNENYYMIGYELDSETGEDHIKHYRVDKMKNITVLEELRKGKERFKNFDMAAYAKMSFGMYGGDKETVKIEFPNSKVGIFIDRFGKDISIIPVDDERSVVNVEVAVSSQFFGWIFGLGSDVRIEGPVEVVDEMKKEAEAFLKNMK